MYENLSKELLSQTLPDHLDLSVVGGFVTDGNGFLSRQIDCMLVHGEGEQVPFTDDYKWHISRVVAIIEVKKTLHTNDIADSIPVLQSVKDCQARYIESIKDQNGTVDIESAQYAFSVATKVAAPSYETLPNLSFELQAIFHAHVMEQFSPVFIVLGYSGFKSESAFREGIAGLLEDAVGSQSRLGIASFPQLMVSGDYSAVKANGQPYIGRVDARGVWEFLFSCAENPVVLLLELLWTRLQLLGGGMPPWGDDLETQAMHLFLAARIKQVEGKLGWEYFYRGGAPELLEGGTRDAWSPSVVNHLEATVLQMAASQDGVNLHDGELVSFLAAQEVESDELLRSLMATDLVALDGERLVVVARQLVTVVLPDGTIVAGDDNTGRVGRWVALQEWGGTGNDSVGSSMPDE